jgi:VWFA-related protein
MLSSQFRRNLAFAFLLSFLSVPVAVIGQQGPPTSNGQSGQNGQTTPTTQPPTQDTQTPEAGGPGGDTGAVALPKKSTKEAPPPPDVPKVTNPADIGNYSIRVDVPLVNVDVGVVLEKTRQFIPSLHEANFRVFEDGVEQKITGFQQIKQPITAVLLLEFASVNYGFIYDMRVAADAFARQLRPEDYVAVMTYDLHTHILTDFTQNKQRVGEALSTLTIPMFSDRNMFDALYEALDRVSTIDGRKYIILIGSGRDTFSKVNLDKILKKVKTTPDVTIFTVSTGQMARERADAFSGGGMRGASRDLDYAQADNEMRTFASLTGGQWYNPMFAAAMPEIFHAINDSIRNAYVLSYHPTNAKMDGSYRKLKVEVVDDQGKPLRMEDEKHKQLKYDVIAREGYKAKQTVD